MRVRAHKRTHIHGIYFHYIQIKFLKITTMPMFISSLSIIAKTQVPIYGWMDQQSVVYTAFLKKEILT